jgi:3-oxoacyl-[acyl-carrier protein] reductase
MSKFDLTNKIAIVTGGGTGIGRAITLELARAGADVTIASRSMEHLEPVAKEVNSLGKRCLAVATDVRVPEQVDSMVKRTVDEFSQIDILVNNAGVSFLCSVEDLSPNGWDAVVDINLKGTFLCCKAAGKVMIQQKAGKIINIASVAGVDGSPTMAHYGAAKAGVINFTKSLSIEWGKHNILVNCIAPGLIETEGVKTQMKLDPEEVKETLKRSASLARYGQPEEIAYAVVFLASEASSFITGETVAINGGRMSAA